MEYSQKKSTKNNYNYSKRESIFLVFLTDNKINFKNFSKKLSNHRKILRKFFVLVRLRETFSLTQHKSYE